MPPVQEESEIEEVETGFIKPVIGIIYPPPEVRNIVDKTASFVARNGPEFETRIRQNELNNPKFNFLNPNDPYNAYYQHKVKEFKEGKGQEPMAPKPLSAALARPQEPVKLLETIVPREPPPEFEFVADPPSISAFDLHVVKLTAQFVARNGRQFLTNLMNREQRNYQFDFLRPQHSLFNYFTKLVEQYTKILIPPKDLLNKLRKDSDSAKEVLEHVKYRVEWAKYQEREKRKEAEAQERERVAYAQIDWHDFVVVETVDFQPNESGNLPPPTTSEEIGARLLAQERFHDKNEDDTVEMEVESDEEDEEEEQEMPAKLLPPGANTQVQDMDEDSEGSGDEQPVPKKTVDKPPLPPLPSEVPQPPPLPPMPDQVIVREDYNPKAAKVVNVAPAPDQFLISPITGEKIPADKIQEHMRIGLLDRKWLEQRDRSISEKREQEEVYAAGSSIDSSLKLLAERRTDIFGHGVEEAQIGKKIGEEEKREKEKVTWDGHTASMERVTQKARENISIEEQIQVIHKVKGLLPDEEKERIGPAQPKGGPHPPGIPPPPAPPISVPTSNPPPSTTSSYKPPTSQPMKPSMPPMPRQPPPPPQMQSGIPMPPQPGMMIIHARPPVQPPPMRPPHMLGMPQRPHMPPMPRPPMGQFMNAPRPPQPPQHQPPPPSDEPPSKKAKTEDQLIPEEEFLRRNKGPVNFKVAVPNIQDKAEWKLNGQLLAFTLPLTDSISVIKAKLHEALGMPAGKQKLQCEGLFVKDSNTLAYYNFNPTTVLQLQLKERGGRKK